MVIVDQATKQQIRRMERARDMLQGIVSDTRTRRVVTPEGVALMSSVLCTIAMLEHEIGRHLMAHRDDGTQPE